MKDGYRDDPQPVGPDVPIPLPVPEPGAHPLSLGVLTYKAIEDLQELKKDLIGVVSRLEVLERRVAALENPKTA